LLLYILPLAWACSLCHRLAEQGHKLAIAVSSKSAYSPPPLLRSASPYRIDVLRACEARVGSKVLLGAKLVGRFRLVLDYLGDKLLVSALQGGDGLAASTHANVVQLHFCGCDGFAILRD
jgi:hypothetical protein